MRDSFWLFFLVIILFLSCKDRARNLTDTDHVEEAVSADTITQQTDDPLSEKEYIPNDLIIGIKEQTRNWLNYYGLNIEEFQLTDKRELNLEKRYSYPVDSINITLASDPMRFLYLFSPDKRKYIDLYFYAHYDEKRKAVVFDGEIDHLVWLYDLDSRMSYVVQSWGPSGSCDVAFWINNDSFALLETYERSEFYITIYNIKENQINTYSKKGGTKERRKSFFMYDSEKKGVLQPIYN